MKVLKQGCSLAGHYHCSFDSVLQRNLHPPSKDLQKEAKSVDERLRKEEKLSYHILLPRFLFRFLFGLHLALFRIAYKNDDPDPRLCVDPTSLLSGVGSNLIQWNGVQYTVATLLPLSDLHLAM